MTPPTPPTPGECNPCLVIHKFHDLDEDGQHDPDEPALEGIRFDITAGGKVYPLATGPDGIIRICFPEPVLVVVRELTRPSGGQWIITGAVPMVWQLGCGTTDIWIGNAQIKPGKTGLGGGRQMPREVRPGLWLW